MNRIALALAGIGTLSVCVFASGHSSGSAAQTAPAKPSTTSTSGTTAPIAAAPSHTVARSKTATPAADTAAVVDAQNLLVKQYCSGCHSEKGKAGGVSLVGFDATKATENIVVAEKMIHKLRAGMMPPPNARRPDQEALTSLVESLETRIDRAAALHPNPGSRSFQRLNRVEYARAVKDLLAIDVDVNAYLPPDTISQGFDNVADSQALSATLLEGYLRAAGKVTALAVGDPDAESAEAHYRVPKTSSQLTPRGRRPARHARRHLGHSHVPRRRRLRLPRRPARQRRRLPVRRTGHGRAARDLDQRRAQGAARHRSEDGRGDDQPVAADAADSRRGRTAARHRRLHSAFRGTGQRSRGAGGSHAGRHADRRGLRRHHTAPPQGPEHHRPAAGHRHLGHAEPAQDLHLPADQRARRRDVRSADRQDTVDPGVQASADRARHPGADALLRGRPQGRQLRNRHLVGDRGDARQSAVRVPDRRNATGSAQCPRRSAGAGRRLRAGVAPLLLPVGHGPRRRPAEGRRTGSPVGARRRRQRSQAHAGRPAGQRAVYPFRGAVAAAQRRRRDAARRRALPLLRPHAG